MKPTLYATGGKRLLDLAVALPAGVALFPVLLIVAAVIRFGLGPGVMFTQARPGLSGRPFSMRKFRTMTEARDRDGELLPDSVRLTSLGRVLRSTSLDELPQLWHVIAGHMSLVGPRPLLVEYLSLYSPEQARRHEVRPGITGWAQVNGRNLLDWDQRLALDVWYVDHLSFRLDLLILWKTVLGVVGRSGVAADGHATMPKFTGPQS